MSRDRAVSGAPGVREARGARTGAALPSVLLALGLVAALAVGGAFVTRRWSSNEAARIDDSDLEALAEKAAVTGIVALDSAGLDSLRDGVTAALGTVTAGAGEASSGRVWITRLDSSTCLLTAEAVTASKSLPSNRLSVVVDCANPPVQPVHGRAWLRLP